MILKMLFTGYMILFLAILANTFADYLNICTWYKFIQQIFEKRFNEVLYIQNIFNVIWLFIINPIILAIGYILGQIIYDFLIS